MFLICLSLLIAKSRVLQGCDSLPSNSFKLIKNMTVDMKKLFKYLIVKDHHVLR